MSYFSSIRKRLLYKLFLAIIASGLITACNDPDLNQLTADKGDQLFDYTYTDTTTITLHTIREDSIRADEFSKDLLGAYFDNNIGKVKASLNFEIKLPLTDVTFPANSTLTSIYLQLKYAGNEEYFGDIAGDITLRVYTLDQYIFRDSSYYSTSIIKHSPVEIGSYTGKFAPSDSTVLKIPLTSDFGNLIMNATSDQLSDNSQFQTIIKGIAIVPDDASGTGCIANFLLEEDSSNVTLVYNDTMNYKFQVNASSARVSHFDHDYSGTLAETRLNNPDIFYNNVILQPLAGLKVKVRFPYLKNFVDSGMIAVHKAKILFTPDETSPYLDDKPGALLLLMSDENNKNSTLIDRLEDHYGGLFVEDDNSWYFGITRYFQQLLNDYYTDPAGTKPNGLNLIIPSDNPIMASPLFIKYLNSDQTQSVRLELHYTKISD